MSRRLPPSLLPVAADPTEGYTSDCRYLGGCQRVDIGPAKSFLDDFGL